MADADDDFNLAALNRYGKRQTSTVAGRRRAEVRVPNLNVKRSQGKSRRVVQLNLRVAPEWKARLVALAETQRLDMVEIIEDAMALYEEKLRRAD